MLRNGKPEDEILILIGQSKPEGPFQFKLNYSNAITLFTPVTFVVNIMEIICKSFMAKWEKVPTLVSGNTSFCFLYKMLSINLAANKYLLCREIVELCQPEHC